MEAAIKSGSISSGGAKWNDGSDKSAYINDWEKAANTMWTALGQDGIFVYGGEKPSAVIYAEDNKPVVYDGYADHFVNSKEFETYYDVWNGFSDIDLATKGLGSTRTLTFYSGD